VLIRHYHEVLPTYETGSETSQGQAYTRKRAKKNIPSTPVGPPAIFTKSSVDGDDFMVYDRFARLRKI